MLETIGRRVLLAIPTLFVVTFLVFALLDLAPGDAARSIAGPGASDEQIAAIRGQLDLDEPLPSRYATWVADAATGDMGESLIGGQSVGAMVADALPRTLSLVAVGLLFAGIGAMILGIVPAVWPNGIADRISTLVAAVSLSMPQMWVALILTAVFALDRSWFPALGYAELSEGPWEWFRHLVLPAIAIGGVTAGELGRQLRGALMDVLETDYALSARAKGLRNRKVVFKHGLKNAAVPVVTVLGIRVGQLIGATVIIEEIFLLDGIGSLAVTSVLARDIPVVLAVVLVATLIVLFLNLLVDLSYSYFNPRLRAS